jgi:FeS assembly SUF system protein
MPDSTNSAAPVVDNSASDAPPADYSAIVPHHQAQEDAATTDLETAIVEALKNVYDPEIPVDIYELGLIYRLGIAEDSGHVDVDMTLTAPGCPVAGSMPGWVQEAVASVPGVKSVEVELVWEPPWQPDMMSMRAKLELNMF